MICPDAKIDVGTFSANQLARVRASNGPAIGGDFIVNSTQKAADQEPQASPVLRKSAPRQDERD
jgi:hypothetical protein